MPFISNMADKFLRLHAPENSLKTTETWKTRRSVHFCKTFNDSNEKYVNQSVDRIQCVDMTSYYDSVTPAIVNCQANKKSVHRLRVGHGHDPTQQRGVGQCGGSRIMCRKPYCAYLIWCSDLLPQGSVHRFKNSVKRCWPNILQYVPPAFNDINANQLGKGTRDTAL